MKKGKKWGRHGHVSTTAASIPHPIFPSLDGLGWASAGLGAQGPRNGRRVSEQDCDSRSHSGAQRVCRSRQDRPAWAGTNLGLRCKWSGVACLAGMLDTVRSHPHPVRHTPAHTPPFRLRATNQIGCSAPSQWSPVKDLVSVRQK
jgi:hypothetical protein